MNNEIKTPTIEKPLRTGTVRIRLAPATMEYIPDIAQSFAIGDSVVLIAGECGFSSYIGQTLTISGVTEDGSFYSALAADGKKLIFIPKLFLEGKRND